jgi:hypothetical protein
MRPSDHPSLLAALTAAEPAGAGAAVRVGRLVGTAGDGPLVDFEGNPGGPAPARSLLALTPEAWRAAVAERREVVLLFDGGDPRRPIVAGLLQPVSATPTLDAALEATLTGTPGAAEVDGRRQVIEGQDEVVLRCGQASITLKRNGRVVIRGLYVETHAAGTNRVKGATVKIN